VIYQVTQSGDAGIFVVNPDGLGDDYAAGSIHGDPVWQGGDLSYVPGDYPDLTVSPGYESSNFTVEFYDEPTAPTSFSGGSSTADKENHWGEGYSLGYSTLNYMVAQTAPFQATISLAGGTINVDGHTFASSGTLPLGELRPGRQSINVMPVEGPDARWTISIAPAPISLYNVKFRPQKSAPGDIDTVFYSVDGGTAVSATVKRANGRAVRTLATALHVGDGTHHLTWDGRDNRGHKVPDGVYHASVTSKDPQDNVRNATAVVTVQRPPPPLVRVAYDSFLIDAHNGPYRKACTFLTAGAQQALARRMRTKTCVSALRRKHKLSLADDRLAHRPQAWKRLILELGRQLHVRQRSLYKATAHDYDDDLLKLTETRNRWLLATVPGVDI
jgi:hypothetical protein